eukprot:1187316-Prorocentrum_minimum.AAC.3
MGLPMLQSVFWISLNSPKNITAATRKASSPRAINRLGWLPSAVESFAAGFGAGRFTGFPATFSRPASERDASSVSPSADVRLSMPCTVQHPGGTASGMFLECSLDVP